jgi:sec-independent protein translocase protein TatA
MPRGMELLIILGVLLLLFGASRLPALGGSLGSAIRNFKKGFGGEETPEDQAKSKGSGSIASGADLKSETKVASKES